MKEYSDEGFWSTVSVLLEAKIGIGSVSNWNKSTINNFLHGFLDELESQCRADENKALLCGIPVIKGEIAEATLAFSYDSFRRIFLTKESNGSKTSKNMFAIYLGFNNYTVLWVKQMSKPTIRFDLNDFDDPNLLFQETVTFKLAQYFEYAIFSMLNLAVAPNKSLLVLLSEKGEININLLTILEGLYFFDRREWYLSSYSFNKSHHLFSNYYQFYFLTGISFYQIKYGNYGAKNAKRYIEKAVLLLPDDVHKSIKCSVYTFYGAILLHNENLDKSRFYLESSLNFATSTNEISKIHYYLSRLSGLTNDMNQAVIATKYLRKNSGKYYALAMNNLKYNAKHIYEDIKYKGGYDVVEFD